MKGVELDGQVWRAVYVEGMSRREAARRFGGWWRRCWGSRHRPPARPKLDPTVEIIDLIL